MHNDEEGSTPRRDERLFKILLWTFVVTEFVILASFVWWKSGVK